MLAVLKDGRLVTASNDTELRDVGIRIWSKDFTGKPKVYQTSGGRAVYSLTVLKDERLASSGSDFQITLWPRDFTSKKEILDKKASVMAVLEDGRLASGDEDGKIRLWPKDFGGTPEVLSHGSPVTSLVVLKDGRLASGGKDGTIKLWLVDEQKLIAALCLRVGRDLSKADWGRYFGDTPWQPSCSAFGIPSNWQQTDDDAESSALASDNTPTEVQPAAPPASAVLRVPLASADLSPALPEPAQPPVAHEPAAQSSPQTAVPPASAKESPVPAPDFGDPGNIGKPREIATPVAPKNPGPRPAQGSQHVAHTAPHGNMPTTTGNTTSQLNQQELARQKSVASMPDNIISGFFRSLFR